MVDTKAQQLAKMKRKHEKLNNMKFERVVQVYHKSGIAGLDHIGKEDTSYFKTESQNHK